VFGRLRIDYKVCLVDEHPIITQKEIMGCRIGQLPSESVDVIWAHCHTPSRLGIPARIYPPTQGTGKLIEELNVRLLLDGVRILITDSPSKQAFVCAQIAAGSFLLRKLFFTNRQACLVILNASFNDNFPQAKTVSWPMLEKGRDPNLR
jgi:hypothetical protein